MGIPEDQRAAWITENTLIRQEAASFSIEALALGAETALLRGDATVGELLAKLSLHKAVLIQIEPVSDERNERLLQCYDVANSLIHGFGLYRTDSNQ